MPDLVLDTNILADLLAQYFTNDSRNSPVFQKGGTISAQLAAAINQIVHMSSDPLIHEYTGHLVTSTLAFVEIARKWESIAQARFSVAQMAAFVAQPPEWFIIEPIDEFLVSALCSIPDEVRMPDGNLRSLEWTDAVHLATACVRGADTQMAASDREMRQYVPLRHNLM